jgi:hypothetical protein
LRACEWASLRLDSQLSEICEMRLKAHLARCLDCRRFTANMTAVTETLRAAPLEEPTYVFEPRRIRSARGFGLRAVSAAAAAAAAAAALLVGSSGLTTFQLSTSSAPSAAASDKKLIGLKEEQMEMLDTTRRALVREVRRGVAAAERATIGSSARVEHRRPAEPLTRLSGDG